MGRWGMGQVRCWTFYQKAHDRNIYMNGQNAFGGSEQSRPLGHGPGELGAGALGTQGE